MDNLLKRMERFIEIDKYNKILDCNVFYGNMQF